VIADGAAIGVMRSDPQVGLVVEQAINDVHRPARRRDSHRVEWRLRAAGNLE